ncbi:MAG: class I SAM-dependent methyltransferase [Acidimicrobiales bacterium]
MNNISFDRIAECYDETRGGLERGQSFMEVIDPLLAPQSDVLEIGVGTGAIARPVVDRGHRLWGVDLSREMLTRAAGRVGRLVEGDASRLPFKADSFDSVLAIWAMHVVGDQQTLVDDIGRVLRSGGRVVIVAPRPDVELNDLSDLTYGWGRALAKPDRTAEVVELLAARGWVREAAVSTPWELSHDTPNGRASSIERREWSSLWDLDDQTWNRVIQPTIDALRALPGPDDPRPLRVRYPVTVYRMGQDAS